jgi:fumarylpyruvate hydrolase
MSFVIDPAPQPVVPVQGGGDFPVRRVWCVGRNYIEHVREMGNDEREPPFFFLKPADAVIAAAEVPYPPATSDLHHEVELMVALGKGGRDVSTTDAPGLIWGAGVAVDLTRRDLQGEAKKAGRPWAMAKGFDASAPVGALLPIANAPGVASGRIWLSVNGGMRQEGDLSQMTWSVAEVIAALSRLVALAPGDLILTGTPAGVGALTPGDDVACGIDGYPELRFRITPG